MIKLLAVDMDGTCLNRNSRITKRTMDALHRLSQAGILFVPATGRALDCLPGQLRQAPFYDYVISSNGAKVRERKTNTLIWQSLIPQAAAVSLIHSCRKAGIGITAHIDDHYLVEGKLLSRLGKIAYGSDAEASLQIPDISRRIQECGTDVEELQFYFFTPSARACCRQVLRKETEVQAAYDTLYVEVFGKEAGKGAALQHLAETLHLQKEEIACIGDSENDLGMFESSGMKFAMGNAVKALKQQADILLPSNEEDGVAEAIRKYILQD